MIFQKINRDDPEKVFIVVKNSWDTATITSGMAVQWDFTDDVDGVGVTQPRARSTNAGIAAAGICVESILTGDYGLVQVYGYHPSVIMKCSTDGPAGGLGSPLAINAAGGTWDVETFFTSTNSAAGTVMVQPCGFLLSIFSSWTTSRVKMFVKAL